MQKFLLMKICWSDDRSDDRWRSDDRKNSDYEGNSDEEIMENEIPMKKIKYKFFFRVSVVEFFYFYSY